MTDRLYEQSLKGSQAKSLLESPLFQEIMQMVDRNIFDRWCRSSNEEDRMKIWAEKTAAASFLSNVHTLIQNGYMADDEIKRLNEQP